MMFLLLGQRLTNALKH